MRRMVDRTGDGAVGLAVEQWSKQVQKVGRAPCHGRLVVRQRAALCASNARCH